MRSARRLGGGSRPEPVPSRRPYSDLRLVNWIADDFAGHPHLAGIDASATVPKQSLREGRWQRVEFTAHNEYRAPGPEVAFATVIDNRYSLGLEALVLSLGEVYPGFSCEFHVFHDDGLSDFVISRLTGIYPGFRFHRRSTERYSAVALSDSDNHRRVGLLGYLSLEALELVDYERVIVIDADILALGDISPLWTGEERPKAVRDAGALPFALIPESTGRPVLNSGVISLPRRLRTPAVVEEAHALLARIGENQDPVLRRFADQKFWNLFLADKDVEYLPNNFNANHRLVETYFPDQLGEVSLLHITGAKPWFEQVASEEMDSETLARARAARKAHPVTFGLWRQRYGSAIRRSRRSQFLAEEGDALGALRDTARRRPAVLIGNGPSIARTDLSLFEGFEKFAFNWFVNHDDFDVIAPDHLVLASAKFFGGWHISRPSWPEGFLDSLTSRSHKPTLWTSFYFKDFVEATPELRGYQKRYFLFEKPLKTMLQRTGQVTLDLTGSLNDGLTGVLSAGVPIAVHHGARAIALVGCDSNYANPTGTYFYAAEKHRSLTNTAENLSETWDSAGGAGQYCYLRTAQELEAAGVRFVDATLDGALTTVPKLSLDRVRELIDEVAAQSGP